MAQRPLVLSPSWVMAAIAIVAFLVPILLPHSPTLRSSDRLVLWPMLVFALTMMALWIVVWILSLRRKRIPTLVAIVSFLLTAFPFYPLTQQWGCMVGECYW